MKQIKQVYNMLADEQSRDIYMQRINYLVTGKFCYMDYIIDTYVPDLCRAKVSLAQDIEDRFAGLEVIVWGCGHYVQSNWEVIKDIRRLICFCDQNKKLQEEGFNGFPVITPSALMEEHSDAIVVIGTGNYYEEINNELLAGGISADHILHLGHYVTMVSERQYFDEAIIQFESEEVFVDAGAYDLFSTRKLHELCGGRLKKSYAFEPDMINFESCRKLMKAEELSYVELLPYGTWNVETELKFSKKGMPRSKINEEGEEVIKTMPIDQAIKERVTFIKMDVEGAELKSLAGASNTISKYKPKLAICIYHKSEDMVQIPLYIKELVPEYKLYIRHYSNYQCETVLYAVL